MEKISLSQNGDVTVVAFSQPKFLDDGDIQQMGDELFQVVDSGVEKIMLDMSTVQFLSSAALNRLIMLHKRVKTTGAALRMVSVTPEIEKIFAITRLNTLFSIHADVSSALASYLSVLSKAEWQKSAHSSQRSKHSLYLAMPYLSHQY